MKQIVVTNSNVIINKVIDEFLNQLSLSRESLYYFDYQNEETLSKVTTEYFASSLFDEKKIILLRNVDFFSNKTKPKKDIVSFVNELFSNNTENIIIFQTEKVNKENFLVKQYEGKYEIIEANSPVSKELEKFITEYLEKRGLTYKGNSIKRIIDITEGDFDQIVSELNKFILLEEDLTVDKIESLIFDKKGESIFNLTNSFFNKDIKNVIFYIDKMKEQDYQPILILQMLINDLFLMLFISKMRSKHHDSEIKKELKINPYRFTKLCEKINKFDKKEMLKLMDLLILIERDIKKNNPSDQYEILKGKFISNI